MKKEGSHYDVSLLYSSVLLSINYSICLCIHHSVTILLIMTGPITCRIDIAFGAIASVIDALAI